MIGTAYKGLPKFIGLPLWKKDAKSKNVNLNGLYDYQLCANLIFADVQAEN